MCNTVSVLTAARDRIANGNFVKGQLYQKRKNGMAFCSIGAIQSVARNTAAVYRAEDALRTYGIPSGYLSEQNDHADQPRAVIRFNDAAKTRKRDVVRAFDRAIKVLTA